MTQISRRRFTQLLGATAVATGSGLSSFAIAQGKGKVVVVGGGAGGATVAHFVKKGSPELDVTLVEMQKQYTTCFFSNLYLGGFRTFESITHSYDGLAKLGVNVVHAMATDVDTSGKTVSLSDGGKLSYDKLVLSPGIDFKYDSVPGYSEAAAEMMPHAYKAGVQTTLLKKQIAAMDAGGTVVIVPPPNPFRCPPGPYERTSMIANYLKKNKPGSKLMVLDPKPKFSKMALFQEGWADHYADIVEWVSPEFSDGGVKSIDPKAMTVTLGNGDVIKANVANIIPAQKAGMIAAKAGVTKGDWCPINSADFSSQVAKDVHVIGDASVAKAMPKSGFSANSQAKVVANKIQAELAGKKAFPARYRNTCWSLISDNDGVKVGASYKPGDGKVDVASKFISKTGEAADLRKTTYEESIGWYSAITSEMFAKA